MIKMLPRIIMILLVMVLTFVTSDLTQTRIDNCSQYINKTKLLEMSNSQITRVCSVLLVEHGDDTEIVGDNAAKEPRARPSQFEVWGYGLLMVTLIR